MALTWTSTGVDAIMGRSWVRSIADQTRKGTQKPKQLRNQVGAGTAKTAAQDVREQSHAR
jgi:hypothetical protein